MKKSIAVLTVLFATLAFFAVTQKPTPDDEQFYKVAPNVVYRPSAPEPNPTPKIIAELYPVQVNGAAIHTALVIRVVDESVLETGGKGKLVSTK